MEELLPEILRTQNSINQTLDEASSSGTGPARARFVSSFVQRFKSGRTSQSPPVTGKRHRVKKVTRGRPTKGYVLKLVALKEPNQQKRPGSWKALKALRRIGLGNLTEDCIVPADLSAAQFTNFIWGKFPALKETPFRLAHSGADGKLLGLPEKTTPASLKVNRARRCIYIVPCEPIPPSASLRPVCSTCHRTLDLSSPNCLPCQQDREFASTSAKDQQKDASVQLQQNIKHKLDEIRHNRIEAIQSLPEPEEGFKVKCRTQSGCFQRKFSCDNALSVLVTWIGSLEGATEQFTFNAVGQRSISSTESHYKTLQDVGITSACVVNVAWIQPDQALEEPCSSGSFNGERERRNASGTPSVLFNLNRNNDSDDDDDFEDTLHVMPYLDECSSEDIPELSDFDIAVIGETSPAKSSTASNQEHSLYGSSTEGQGSSFSSSQRSLPPVLPQSVLSSSMRPQPFSRSPSPQMGELLHPPSGQPQLDLTLPQRSLSSPLQVSVHPPPTLQTQPPQSPRSPSPPPPMDDVREVKIHRLQVLEDMIVAFQSEGIIHQQLTFSFVGESAVDQSGVSRDAYSSFWDAFYDRRTSGSNTVVPCITVQYCREEWLAVGHILVKGYKDHKIFPIRLNITFLTAMLLGEEMVTDDMLLSSLYSYSPEDVKDMLVRARDNPLDDDDQTDLIEFLADSGWNSAIPNSGNHAHFDKCLLQIAHKILIQTSKYPLVCMADVTRRYLRPDFTDVSSIQSLVKEIAPTNRKVLKLLKANVNSAREQKVFQLLKMYVRGLERDMLSRFLKFCTGSSVMSVASIEVTFNSIAGLQRRPVARTCGPVLELSVMYADITDLRYEFNSILSGGHEGYLFSIS